MAGEGDVIHTYLHDGTQSTYVRRIFIYSKAENARQGNRLRDDRAPSFGEPAQRVESPCTLPRSLLLAT